MNLILSKILNWNKKDLLINLFFSFLFALYCSTQSRYIYDNPNELLKLPLQISWLKIFLIFFVLFYLLGLFFKFSNIKNFKKIFFILIVLNIISFLILFIENYSIYTKYSIKSLIMGVNIFYFFYFVGLFNFDLSKEFFDRKKVIKLILIICSLYAIILTIKNILIYKNYFLGRYDVGIFLNLLWLQSRFHTPITWHEAIGIEQHRWAIHFDPFLQILAVVYRFINMPEFIFLLSAVAIIFSSFILYLISLEILKDEKLSFLVFLLYFFSPFFARLNNAIFGPDMYLPLFYFLFFYFAIKKDFILSVIFYILSISLKENFSIYLFFSSLYLSFYLKDKKYIFLATFSLLYFIFIVGFLMPSYFVYNSGFSNIILENFFNMNFKIKHNFGQFLFTYLGSVFFIPFCDLLGFIFLTIPPAIIHMLFYRDIYFEWQYTNSAIIGLFPLIIFSIEKIKSFKNTKYFLIVAIFSSCILSIYFIKNFYVPHIKYIFYNIFLIIIFALIFLNLKKLKKIALYSFIFILIFPLLNFYKHMDISFKINKERKLTIDEAVKFIPANDNIPVIASNAVVTKIYNRKYIATLEHSRNGILMPLLTNKKHYNEIYILFDKKGHKNMRLEEIEHENIVFKEIDLFLSKNKYVKKELFNKNEVYVFKYYK